MSIFLRKKISVLILFFSIFSFSLPACKDHPGNTVNEPPVVVTKKVSAVQKKLSKIITSKKNNTAETGKKSDISTAMGSKNKSVANKKVGKHFQDKKVALSVNKLDNHGKLLDKSETTGKLNKKQEFYNSEGKIDPFEPLIKIKRKKESPNLGAGGEEKKPMRILTPLMKLDFSQMRLVAIVIAESGNIAMVEDSTNKGYTIRRGTCMGRNDGRVVKINKDSVVIMEHIKNFKGEIVTRSQILRLHKPGDKG